MSSHAGYFVSPYVQDGRRLSMSFFCCLYKKFVSLLVDILDVCGLVLMLRNLYQSSVDIFQKQLLP